MSISGKGGSTDPTYACTVANYLHGLSFTSWSLVNIHSLRVFISLDTGGVQIVIKIIYKKQECFYPQYKHLVSLSISKCLVFTNLFLYLKNRQTDRQQQNRKKKKKKKFIQYESKSLSSCLLMFIDSLDWLSNTVFRKQPTLYKDDRVSCDQQLNLFYHLVYH